MDERAGERALKRPGLERDFGRLARLERNAETGQMPPEILGGGEALPSKATRGGIHAELLEPFRAPADPRDGKRIEEFVGEDPSGHRARRELPGRGQHPDSRESPSGSEGGAAGPALLDGGQTHARREGAALGPQGRREVLEEPPVARADFHEVERSLEALGLTPEAAGDRGGEERRDAR